MLVKRALKKWLKFKTTKKIPLEIVFKNNSISNKKKPYWIWINFSLKYFCCKNIKREVHLKIYFYIIAAVISHSIPSPFSSKHL